MTLFKEVIDRISSFKIFNQIIFMLRILRFLEIKPGTKLAILSKNTKGWMVTFWTALLGEMPIVIIDVNESRSRIIDILNRNAVSVLFIDKELFLDKDYFSSTIIDRLFYTNLIFSVPYVTSISFKMELLQGSANKLLSDRGENWYELINKLNILKKISNLESDSRLYEINLIIDDFIGKKEDATMKIFKMNDFKVPNDDSIAVIAFSPGVTESSTYRNGKLLSFRHLIAISENFAEYYPYACNKITSFASFSQWFPFLVVYSVLYNKELVYPNRKDEDKFYVYDTVSFENMWKEEFESKLQTPFYRNMYLLFPFLYRKYIKKRFYEVFGNKVREVTILNSQVRGNIMYHLSKCDLPVTTTFGSVQGNYITRKFESYNIFNGAYEFIRNEDGTHYKGRIERNYGRSLSKGIINLEQIENTIKCIPFVTNCVVFRVERGLHAIIELDQTIYDVSTREARLNNILIFSKLKTKVNKLLVKQIGIEIDDFSFENNMMVASENKTAIPKALNGQVKLVYFD